MRLVMWTTWTIQGVALNGVFFFYKKKKNGRFCCVHCFGSGDVLQHLVPERIPLRKLRKMFRGKNACGRDGSRSIRCLMWGVSHCQLAQVGALRTLHLAFEPELDQIRAAAKVLRC